MDPFLVLIYGPNGAGKTTIARALATKHRGLHIQIDTFSSMARGKLWHTRQNNRDKVNLVIGVLDAAMSSTKYRYFFLDGVLIYRFMFKLIEEWCERNGVKFISVYLDGELIDLDYRIEQRKKLKNNWNELLPEIYNSFSYKPFKKISTSNKNPEDVVSEIEEVLRKGGAK